MKMKILLIIMLMTSFSQMLSAKIDLVTLPERESVQITIYNSEDITLVKEMRSMSFKKGENEIQFSWAGTLIDPTSLNLKFLSNAESLEILDVTYPPNIANTLIWHIDSKISGEAQIEIMYFTSGLTWAADYVATADKDEKTMSLKAFVKVTNNSGEDYENTSTRLLVGEIHLVEKVADLAVGGLKREVKDKMMEMEAIAMDASVGYAMPASPKEIVKEGISEYFLYSIEGQETIKNGWSKRLLSFDIKDIPFKLTYAYDETKYGDQIVKLYKLKNEKDAKLGKEPLPDGTYKVFKENAENKLVYINSETKKYVPIDEDIDLNLGSDGLITFEPKLMNYIRDNIQYDKDGYVIGWDTKEDFILEIRNSKNEAIPLEITRYFDGKWEIETEMKYEKIDKNSVKFKLTAPALGKSEIKYTLIKKFDRRTN